MKPTDALRVYRQLMTQHGLGHDWTCKVCERSISSAGRCFYGKKTITISSWYLKQATDDEVRNTMLHEIAHALVGVGHHHNSVWRAKAVEIGCTGDRCHTRDNPERSYKFIAACSGCNAPHYASRINPRKKYRCGRTRAPLIFTSHDGPKKNLAKFDRSLFC